MKVEWLDVDIKITSSTGSFINFLPFELFSKFSKLAFFSWVKHGL